MNERLNFAMRAIGGALAGFVGGLFMGATVAAIGIIAFAFVWPDPRAFAQFFVVASAVTGAVWGLYLARVHPQ